MAQPDVGKGGKAAPTLHGNLLVLLAAVAS